MINIINCSWSSFFWEGKGEGEDDLREAIQGRLALEKFSRVENDLWNAYAPDEDDQRRKALPITTVFIRLP